MMSRILKWIVIILATLNFGYMCYDGSRALIQGDYLRPGSGEHAGQLGPWANVVTAIGIEPESTLMKSILLVWGGAGLILMVCYAMEIRKSDKTLMVFNIASFWYLAAGTLSSAIQVILLLIIRSRNRG
jgi:hypothetical protein